MEVLIVDDRSEDNTYLIAQRFCQRYPFMRVLPIRELTEGLSGKQQAIHRGVQVARGEIILLTDADCRVPPSWPHRIVSYFDSDTGMVCGQTLLWNFQGAPGAGAKLWSALQALDWLYLLTIASGVSGLGKPVSAIGNNMAFRKVAYKQVGGYPAIGFSVTEDFALLKAIAERTSWRIQFPIDPEITVRSLPLHRAKDFIRQRQRWVAGGKGARPYGKFVMAAAFLFHLIGPLGLLFSTPGALWALMAVVIADAVLLLRTLIPLRQRALMLFFPLFELFYFLYTSLFAPILLFSSTVRWKGVTYRRV